VFAADGGDLPDAETGEGNRANRRPISFKDSTAFVSTGYFFVNSTQAGGMAKKTAPMRTL
jgi:hypothetical protein